MFDDRKPEPATWRNVGKSFLILLAVMVAAGVLKAIVNSSPPTEKSLRGPATPGYYDRR